MSEFWGHRLSIFDIGGQKIQTFGSCGDRPDQMKFPKEMVTGDTNNNDVCSQLKAVQVHYQ